ncbi:MAG: flagellar hook-basal body complex protein [Nibricoccus sp.]
MSLIGTLTSGVSAMRAFTKGLEVIGNNIANVNTVAYKGSTVSFADSFSNTLRSSAPSSATSSNQSATQVGTGVRLSEISTKFTQGALTTTGLNTDLGVSGNGFFLVSNPADGQLFATRAGNFRIDDSGYLVTYQGYRVQGATGGTAATPPSAFGSIRLGTPPAGTELTSFSISTAGNLTEFYSDGTSITTNQVLLQNYSDLSALVKQGDNLYTGFSAAGIIGPATPTPAGNAPAGSGLGSIQAGTLELANVDLTDQFANMITTQRSFQASSRLITVSDSVLEDIVNLKR